MAPSWQASPLIIKFPGLSVAKLRNAKLENTDCTQELTSSRCSKLLILIFGQQNPQLCFSANVIPSLKVLKLATELPPLAYESSLISSLQLV